MAKYNVPYKLKGGFGVTLHMIVNATSGYVSKAIVKIMIAANGGEVIGTPVPVK